MNIMDLAKAIDPECKTEIIGIRAGEKIHEVMIPLDEARRTLEFDGYYLLQPDFRFWEKRNNHSGKPVDENFEYNSGTNPWILTVDEMKRIIKTL